MAVLCLGVRVRREVILDRRLLTKRKYNGENEQQSGKGERMDEHACLYKYHVHRQSLYVIERSQKMSLHFLSHSLLAEIM